MSKRGTSVRSTEGVAVLPESLVASSVTSVETVVPTCQGASVHGFSVGEEENARCPVPTRNTGGIGVAIGIYA